MIIELHLLQSFPVSNLNRDDVNQPKTATFGGHTRGRISSQSLKRAARLLFNDYGLDASETGVRTKRLVDYATHRLLDKHGRDDEHTRGVVVAGLEQLGFGIDATKGLTQYLLFVGRDAVDHLADYCDRNWDGLYVKAVERAAATADENKNENKPGRRKAAKPTKIKPDKAAIAEGRRILDAGHAADIALFGRMITDNKDFSVHAASQVATPSLPTPW